MELLSLQFLLFIVAFLALYFSIGRLFPKLQWIALLVGSMAFYGLAGSWKAFGFVVLEAGITWAFSHAFARIERTSRQRRKAAGDRAERKLIKLAFVRRKRMLFAIALACSLVVLLYLKYAASILSYMHLDDMSAMVSRGLVLPLGISFFTFQSVSYLIDTYNGKYGPEGNFFKYLLFVSYFPQLVQGPINRFDEMRSQLCEAHRLDWRRSQRALLRILLGVIKKCAISDVLVFNVNAIVLNVLPTTPGSLVLWGVIMYSIQMYGDFSGGIDIVEGVSELLGIQMMQNFRQPYFSTSLADFWRRWHISLGAWMRDYVFYPLALTQPMQRFGKWGTKRLGRHLGRTLPACVANIVTFLLVGLWHGAAAHYILWGIYNGVVVALSDLLEPVSQRMRRAVRMGDESPSRKVIGAIRTFALVCVGRYFDCIPRLASIKWAIRNTVLDFAPQLLPQSVALAGLREPQLLGYPAVALLAICIVAVVDIWEERGIDARDRVLSWGFPARIALYLALGALIGVAMFYTGDGGGFLYANF